MEILLTGASGFVGGALGRYMRSIGWHVTGVSRGPPRQEAADVVVRHDLTQPLPDTAALRRPFDALVHAAALSAPWGRPDRFDRVNVGGTRAVLALAARHPRARVVLISSSSVLYAPGDQFDLPEEPAPGTPPVNDYARTKRRAEDLVRAQAAPWTILRPRAVFGVGDTVLFPRIARAARLRMLPRFRRAGAAVGDLVSIDNLVRQTVAAIAGGADGILHCVDAAPVGIEVFVAQALARAGLPPPSFSLRVQTAERIAGTLEALSGLTGWWEPPLTRFGVGVFANSKTFDARRAHAALGPPPVPTDIALDRFVAWWRDGARLDDAAMGRVGAPAVGMSA